MNCERFQTIAGDLARNENRDTRRGSAAGVAVMEADDRADALAHIDTCGHCGQILTAQNDLSERLRSVAERMKFLQAPAHVEQQLLATFRDQTHGRSRPTRPYWRYWLSAAAVLLVAFGLLAWRAHVASKRQSPAQANSQSATAPPSQAPKQEQLLSTTVDGPQSSTGPSIQSATQSWNGSAPKRTRRHSASSQLAKRAGDKPSIVEPAAGVATNAETKEVVTEFVSVGYGSALDLQDGGQLVRVELPRSALARFGLPVNMNRVDEKVKADVLVGADGLARAIRFVQ